MQIQNLDNVGSTQMRRIDFQYVAAGMQLTVRAGTFVWQGYDSNGRALPWLQDGAAGQEHSLTDDEVVTVEPLPDPQMVVGHLVRMTSDSSYRILTHTMHSPVDPPMPLSPLYQILHEIFHLEVPGGATDLTNAKLIVFRLV